MESTNRNVIAALDNLKNAINSIADKSKFAPGSKKSGAWLKKLAVIEADIRAEEMRESIIAASKPDKKE